MGDLHSASFTSLCFGWFQSPNVNKRGPEKVKELAQGSPAIKQKKRKTNKQQQQR